MTCRDCGDEFKPLPGKPGYINQCLSCATDVPLLGGNLIYSHKTAPALEIKSLEQAQLFAKLSRRFGHGVTISLTQSRELAHRQQTLKILGLNPFSGE